MSETKTQTASRSAAFVMRLAVLLLSLTCLTMGMVANLRARFVTQDNGSDDARAASFSYVISPGTTQALDLANLAPGDEKRVSFTIAGQSEAAVCYTVEVLTTGNLPLVFELRQGSESGTELSCIESDVNNYKLLSFALNKTVASNVSDTTTYYLKVSWPSSANSSTYANKVEEVVLNVYAVQID